MQWHALNPDEEDVIVRKATERPFSGEYLHCQTNGMYVCRRCGAFLFRSGDKFDSGCGWPSFDDEVLGAVKRTVDPDGQRTEILCARCQAHLGHVFQGEHLTAKNIRHCVNSISLKFIDQSDLKMHVEYAYLGGGCFWCLEAVFVEVKGVVSVISGYAGGHVAQPSYEQVCAGETGHVEVVCVSYDPTIIAYEAILEVFFAIHDPRSLNRQGADQGTQYRSIILYTNALEKEIAEHMIADLNAREVSGQSIVTEIQILEKFYPAEEYHQGYFVHHPHAPYCQAVISPKIAKFKQHYKNYRK